MIERIQIVGARGRVGSAVSARLAERGIAHDSADPELVLLCVPDRAIGEVAAGTPVGPWIAHVSGATPLDALDPHVPPFRAASAAVVLEGGRRRAARRRLGRCHRGERRCARRRLVAGGDARPPSVRARRRRRAPPTTQARRWPRTTSLPCAAPRAHCSRRPARRRRRSTRSSAGWSTRASSSPARSRAATGRRSERHLAVDPRRAPGARGALPRARRSDRPHRRP